MINLFDTELNYVWVIILTFIIYGILIALTQTKKVLNFFEFLSIHRARPFRNITEKEKTSLKKYYESEGVIFRKFYEYPASTQTILISIIVFGLFLLSIPGLVYFVPHDRDFGLVGVIMLFLSIIGYIFYAEYKSKRFREQMTELTMPVYVIQGRIYFDSEKKEHKKSFDYAVGRYKFHYESTEAIVVPSVELLPEGTPVTIEFSPLTHFVWRVTKL